MGTFSTKVIFDEMSRRRFSIPPNQLGNSLIKFEKNVYTFLTTLESFEFFYALDLTYGHSDGSYKISNGDVIVMNNCGLHRGRNTEPQLRAVDACKYIGMFL